MATRKMSGNENSSAPVPRLTQGELAWVVCPVCRSALEVAGADGLRSEGVRCTGCQRVFPVVDGIPVLLEARAVLGI